MINRQQTEMTIAIIAEEGVSKKHDTVSYTDYVERQSVIREWYDMETIGGQ